MIGQDINTEWRVKLACEGDLPRQTKPHISSVLYWPHGVPYSFVRGNNVWHAATFHSRLQQTESYEALNNSINGVLFVGCPNWGQYSNAAVYDFCPHTDSAPDNGNLRGYDEYQGGPGYSAFLHFSDTYLYDNFDVTRFPSTKVYNTCVSMVGRFAVLIGS